MKNAQKLLSAPIAALLAGTILLPVFEAPAKASPLMTQEAEKPKKEIKTRKVKALREKVFKKIQASRDPIAKLQEENPDAEPTPAMYKQAVADLEAILTSRSAPNEYERAVIYQEIAGHKYSLDDTRGALEMFLKVLELGDEIPVAQEVGLTMNVSQLYASLDDMKTAIKYYKKWEEMTTVVSINNLVYGAQLYYSQSDFPKTVDYINRAIADAETVDTIEPAENWYQLRFSSEYEQKKYTDALVTAEILYLNWTKPTYWLQMAQLNQELGKTTKSYQMLEAAYRMGYLDDQPSQITNTASVLFAQDVPIKAAWVLDEAVKKGLIEDSAKNQLTLGRAYYASASYKKAIEPLSRGAAGDDEQKPEGDTWLQVGNTLMALERYKQAEEAFTNAIKLYERDAKEKGKKKKAEKRLFSTYMQLVSATGEQRKYTAAKDALKSASKFASTRRDRRAISQWRDYWKIDEERQRIIAEAVQ